jgi:hypothetical protein
LAGVEKCPELKKARIYLKTTAEIEQPQRQIQGSFAPLRMTTKNNWNCNCGDSSLRPE